MMPPWQDAIAALAPIVGLASISGIVIALHGWIVASRRGGRPEGAMPSVSGMSVSTDDVRQIIGAMHEAAAALHRCAEAPERTMRSAHEVADTTRGAVGVLGDLHDELERGRREE
jgi:hypothetical protein